VLSKSDYVANHEEYMDENAEPRSLFLEYTTGTSGQPMKCVKSRQELLLSQRAIWSLRKEWLPQILQERLLVFANSVMLQSGLKAAESTEGIRPGADYYGNLRFKYLTPRDLAELPLTDILDFIGAWRPAWIRATPSNAYAFALRLQSASEGRPKALASLRFVEVSGEVLDDNCRETIEMHLGCPVANHYGTREIWPLAYECPKGRLHWVEDHAFVEILHHERYKDGAGEACLTALRQRTFPYIRYNIGDVVALTWEQCPCGREGAAVKNIQGRRNTMISINEQYMSSHIFSQLIKSLAKTQILQVSLFRVVQKTPTVFHILVESKDPISDEAREATDRFLKRYLHPKAEGRLLRTKGLLKKYEDKHLFFYSEIN